MVKQGGIHAWWFDPEMGQRVVVWVESVKNIKGTAVIWRAGKKMRVKMQDLEPKPREWK